MPDVWISFFGFAGLLIVLVRVKREITTRLLHIGWLLFQHESAAALLYFLIMLPGIMLHEVSHLLMATLLGVRAGGLSLWPKVQRNGLQLGSVQVRRTDPVRESLIGLAPLLGGSAAILLIARLAFDIPLAGAGGPIDRMYYLVEHAQALLHRADAAIWLYLIFAISNAMLPSPSDRQPWRSLAIYVGVVGGTVLLFNGGLPRVPPDLIAGVTRTLDWLGLAFALTLLLDGIVVVLIYLVQQLLAAARGAAW
jgi:hypothetical protein